MNKSIPYGRQEITEDDIQEVVRVLKSDFLTQGPEIKIFEDNFASYVHSNFGVAVSNGTAALHLASMALGVNKGDKVVTSPLTFCASANCILYNGGEVLFSDIDGDGLLDLDQLQETLATSKNIVGVIPVDYAGYPSDTQNLRNLLGPDRWILEDSCHAPGAWRTDSKGDKVFSGSNRYTDASIFSFHPVKHIATGEGGIVTCRSKETAEMLRRLRTHGITKDNKEMLENPGGWYYEMHELGFNYRLPDVLAALGSSQLERIEQNIEKRLNIANVYYEELGNLPIKLPARPENGRHAFHLFVIRVNERKKLYDYLRSNNIQVQVHYIPIHLLPYYKKLGFKYGDFPKAEKFYEECISLPMYPSLSESDHAYVIEQIIEFFK